MKIQSTKNITFIALTTLAFCGFADTIQLFPNKDNTLYEHDTSSVSNGIGVYTYIGKTTQSKIRRALFRFDVSSIPPKSTINSVNLELTISKAPAPPVSVASNATIYFVSVDWGEGLSDAGSPGGAGTTAMTNDATWTHRFFNTLNWNTAGGDFMASASATAAFGTANNETLNFSTTSGLIADVQTWVNTPANNFGWIVKGDESKNGNARRLNTRENAAGTPILTIDFTPPTYLIFENGFEITGP